MPRWLLHNDLYQGDFLLIDYACVDEDLDVVCAHLNANDSAVCISWEWYSI